MTRSEAWFFEEIKSEGSHQKVVCRHPKTSVSSCRKIHLQLVQNAQPVWFFLLWIQGIYSEHEWEILCYRRWLRTISFLHRGISMRPHHCLRDTGLLHNQAHPHQICGPLWWRLRFHASQKRHARHCLGPQPWTSQQVFLHVSIRHSFLSLLCHYEI